ncbi:MAG: sigma-70 family RNA polymerase sigma factor [bacterium]
MTTRSAALPALFGLPVGRVIDPQGDEVLVALARRGRTTAFETLLARHRAQARAIAGRVLRHDEAGLEDVLAEANYRAFTKLHLLRDGARFRSWYCAIVRNAALDWSMRVSRERGLAPECETGEELEEDWWARLVSDAPNPEARVESADLARAVREALADLEELYRQPMLRRFVNDEPYDTIAASLGKPVGTVKSLVHRGKGQVARYLITRNVLV